MLNRDYWSNAQLAAFEAELAALNKPNWSQELHRTTRRQFNPTYAEAREDVRNFMRHYIIAPLRRLAEPDCPPGWLTPKGITQMHRWIREKRVEHSALIHAENAHVDRPGT